MDIAQLRDGYGDMRSIIQGLHDWAETEDWENSRLIWAMDYMETMNSGAPLREERESRQMISQNRNRGREQAALSALKDWKQTHPESPTSPGINVAQRNAYKGSEIQLDRMERVVRVCGVTLQMPDRLREMWDNQSIDGTPLVSW